LKRKKMEMKKYVASLNEFIALVNCGYEEDLVLHMTPEIACFIDENYNQNNRKPSRERVEKYVRQIREGHWKCKRGVDPLKMDKEHNVISGGHRVKSVILAGMAADFNVQLNLDCDIVEIQDDSKSRINTDNNADLSKRITAICTYLTGLKMSTAEETLFFEHFRERFDEIGKMFPSHRKGVTAAPLLGEFFKAYSYISIPKLRRFARILSSGYTENMPGDNSLITLRNAMMDGKAASTDEAGNKVFWPRIQSVLQNADRGRDITKIVELKTPVYELEEDIAKVISKR